MGYMCHHAILVTSWSEEAIQQAHAEARRLLGAFDDGFGHRVNLVSEILGSATNDYRSFFIAPDGSQEGWDLSERAAADRARFIHWLRQQVHEDGSSKSLDWAHVQFGDGDGDQRILEATRAAVGPEGNLIAGEPTARAAVEGGIFGGGGA